jgi:hypothetical protein
VLLPDIVLRARTTYVALTMQADYDCEVLTLGTELLMGQDKWLGGVPSVRACFIVWGMEDAAE